MRLRNLPQLGNRWLRQVCL